MAQTKPIEMQAAAINRFGEETQVQSVPVPEIGADEVLIHVEAAGVAVWDPDECEGRLEELTPAKATFPYIPGTDAAGEIVAVGKNVTQFANGDRVWAVNFLNPKGGCYAEYIAVEQKNVAKIPERLSTREAGAMPADALTALWGLELLKLKPGETLMILGASGGIGHFAIQLAKRMGVKVFAVASGQDGVDLAKRLKADAVMDGKQGDIATEAKKFAPDGVDALLLTFGGDAAEKAFGGLKAGGRVVYPDGVEPVPKKREGLTFENYSMIPNTEIIQRLNSIIKEDDFVVHVDEVFALHQVPAAFERLRHHHLGKLVLSLT